MSSFATSGEEEHSFLVAEGKKSDPAPALSRSKKLLLATEWILVHQGTLCFIMINIAIFAGGYSGAPPTTKMNAFVSNPLDAWPKENLIAYFLMFFYVGVIPLLPQNEPQVRCRCPIDVSPTVFVALHRSLLSCGRDTTSRSLTCRRRKRR